MEIDENLNQTNNFYFIEQKLLQQHQLQILDQQTQLKIGDYETLVVKDQSAEYTLLMIKISYRNHQISQQLLKNAQKKAQTLREGHHPNIVKYIHEFQIDEFYFIQLERCHQSLQDWIESNGNQKINNPTYIRFAFQMLEGLQYLHQNNLFLKNPSLKTILLDSDLNLRLFDFEHLDDANSLSITQSSYQSDYFFTPPEYYDEKLIEKSKEINSCQLAQQKDIWQVCMILYVIAGASKLHAIKFAQGQQPFTTQFNINHWFNLVLANILQRNPQKRPTIQNIIEQFKKMEEIINSNQIELESNEHKQMIQQVQQLFENKQYKESITILIKLLKQTPNNDDYLARLGRLYNCISRSEESEYWSNQSLILNPRNEIAYFNLGNTYRNRKQTQQAIYYYEKCIEINPRNVSSLNNLGLVYDQEQMHDKGIEIFKRALEIEPNNPSFIYNLGRNYNFQNNNIEAQKSFEQVIQINPQYIDAYFQLGTIHKNDIDKAIMYYKKSLEINPKYVYSLFELGKIYYTKKQNQKSLVCIKRTNGNLNTLSANYTKASSFYCLKQYDKSAKYYKRALKYNQNEQYSKQYLLLSKKFI